MQMIVPTIPLISLAVSSGDVRALANIVTWDGRFYVAPYFLLLESICLWWGDSFWLPESSPVSAGDLPVAEVPALSEQHDALPAAVGTAAVQHWHVRFSHDAVADSGSQIFNFNNLVFSFVHQDPVLLQSGVKTAGQAHCPSKCVCD